MTANPVRRRRTAQLGGVALAGGLLAVVLVSFLAVTTLRSSRAGRAPEVDVRRIVEFPDTPNAAVGIVDDLDRLTSLAVLTLDPSGIGGSVVVIPVNVDANNGFGPERRPISRRPFTPGDDEQAAELIVELEPLLTLTIEASVVVGPDQLRSVLEPVAPLEVDLPERVVDSDSPGSGFVAAAGERTLDLDRLVAAFTAISADSTSYSHHDIDVALWSAIADSESGSVDVDVPVDEFGRPTPPATTIELVERLFSGDVAARDLAVLQADDSGAENPDDADFVVVDRLDAVLVFTAISPGLVSTPNEALSFRLVVGYDEAQLGVLGDGPDGAPIGKEALVTELIGGLLFGRGNVVAIDLSDDPDSVPATTRLVVGNEDLVDDLDGIVDAFFEGSEIEVGDEVIDNAQVTVVLGLDYLERQAQLSDTVGTDG